MSEAFTTCACQNCGKLIEFDRSQLPVGETRIVECPHCHLETIIFARKPQPPPVKEIPPVSPIPTPTIKKPTATILGIGSVIMLLVGLALVIAGCGGDVEESTRETGSAIRQTVYAVQYGTGLVLITLSMILGALCRLITGD